MNESTKKVSVYIVLLILLILPELSIGQQSFEGSSIRFYEKNELNWGLLYQAGNEREELITDVSKQLEEVTLGQAKFLFNNKRWTFLDYKQEQLDLNLEMGPLWGSGNFVDSTAIENRIANHSIFGFRLNGVIDYTNRFYYTEKSYTVVHVKGIGNFDLFRKHAEGASLDSNNVATEFDTRTNKSKFNYGFTARAGWGVGRLNPMNHVMVADYLFDNYYSGKKFDKNESDKIIQRIEKIKSSRSVASEYDSEEEINQLYDLINKQLFLTLPEGFENEWLLGEFLPRLDGSRVEIGPFFKYYNHEPDFIYGGYVQYNSDKYCNHKWNRRLNAGLNYSWYKRQDWMMAEIELGWSYYKNLKSQFDFGVKYVPGITLNYFEDIGKLNHGFIPYVGYYSQINHTTRVSLTAALRISEDDGLLFPGPEFSLAFYRSKY